MGPVWVIGQMPKQLKKADLQNQTPRENMDSSSNPDPTRNRPLPPAIHANGCYMGPVWVIGQMPKQLKKADLQYQTPRENMDSSPNPDPTGNRPLPPAIHANGCYMGPVWVIGQMPKQVKKADLQNQTPRENMDSSPNPDPTGNRPLPPAIHQSDADEDDENVKQLQQCSYLYLSLQDCLDNSNRNWKTCQKEVQAFKACNDRRQKEDRRQ